MIINAYQQRRAVLPEFFHQRHRCDRLCDSLVKILFKFKSLSIQEARTYQLMEPTNKQANRYWGLIVAVLVSLALASHQLWQADQFGLIGNYLYWLVRILIQVGCFVAVLTAVENYAGHRLSRPIVVSASVLLSLVPYALAITAFDLIAGLPELGLNGGAEVPESRAGAFALELLYLLDNHIAVCLLVYLPRMITADALDPSNVSSLEHDSSGESVIERDTLFQSSFDPPLQGDICHLEAQEHYVRILTTDETRMLLYRFSDAVKQMPSSTGMQTHRSHWVANAAVKGLIIKGQSLKVELNDGTLVPVSRTFRAAVEQRFNSLEAGSA